MVFTVGTGRLIPTQKICQVLDLESSDQHRLVLIYISLPFSWVPLLLPRTLWVGQLWSNYCPAPSL